jgi:26S proteasome regulatory subunit N2
MLSVATSAVAASTASSSTVQVSSSNSGSNALGWLAVLSEPNERLQRHALEQLWYCVDWEWHVIAPALADLEALAESNDSAASASASSDPALPSLAAAVASKVFFYLDEPSTALRLALRAGGTMMDGVLWMDATSSGAALDESAGTGTTTTTTTGSAPPATSPYAVALLRAALDAYIVARRSVNEAGVSTTTSTSASSLDMAQLQPLVYRLLESACMAGQYEYAVGLCLEACDVEPLQSVLQHAATAAAAANSKTILSRLLPYVVTCVSSGSGISSSSSSSTNKTFAQQAVALVASHWQQLFEAHFGTAATASTASTSTSTTFQHQEKLEICYDLVHTLQRLEDTTSVARVLATLLGASTTSPQSKSSQEEAEAMGLTALQLVFDLVDTGDQAFVQRVADALTPLLEASSLLPSVPAPSNETSTTTAAAAAPAAASSYPQAALSVLVGGFASELSLSFLHKQSGADALVMDALKKNLEERTSGSSRSSVLHNAAVVTHAYLYAGTTNDAFLRQHLDWMKKASNWCVDILVVCMKSPCR